MMKEKELFDQAIAAYKSKDFQQAKILYQACLEQNPEHTESHFNLGTLYMQEQSWQMALNHFKQANQFRPNTVNILYNLSVAHLNCEEFGAALHFLEKTVELDPKNYNARHLYAVLLYKTGNPQKAELQFIEALKLNQNDPESWFNFAVFCLEFNDLVQAEKYFKNVLNCQPNHLEALNNLIAIYQHQNKNLQAFNTLQKLVKYYPDNKTALMQAIICAYSLGNQKNQAIKLCQQGLDYFKNDPSLEFLMDKLQGNKNIQTIPAEYVESLFTSYSNYYDKQMLDTLDYQVHNFISEGLEKYFKETPNNQWNILDLGCGTGICGEAIKPFAKSLTGIDISEGMLKQAEQKKIYTQLITNTIENYLSKTEQLFDLIVAADVFVYLGDLSEIFTQIYSRLNTNGRFIFSIECEYESDSKSEEENYKLNAQMRFQYNPDYIANLINKTNFELVFTEEQICLRKNNNNQVIGNVYFLQRN